MSELIKKAVYVQKINGSWYGYMPLKDTGIVIDEKKNEFLGDFVTRVQKSLEGIGVHPVFKCVQNYGLEDKLKDIQTVLRRFKDGNSING